MRQDDPRHAGSLATLWTVMMVGVAVAHPLGVRLSTSPLRGALHGLGLRWGRPRLAMPRKTDPAKGHAPWVIARAVIEAGPEAALRSADESRLQLLPLIRAMGHWVGQQVRLPTPGTHVSRALCGTLTMRTGQWVYLLRERRRAADFLASLTFSGVPIHRARSGSSWIMSAATPPTPWRHGWPFTHACSCTTGPPTVRI
jgi:hypothetical protein